MKPRRICENGRQHARFYDGLVRREEQLECRIQRIGW